MLNCAKLERQPCVFQSLTGLSLAIFAQLLPAIEQAYIAAQDAADAQRPQAREQQRDGGRKATLATLADKLVFIKAAMDETDFLFPPGSRVWQDTGFQGYAPLGMTIYQPKKKPRGGELTPAEKETNQLLSSERIGVEHSTGDIKVFRIVHDVYRNHRPGYDDLVMAAACGLANLRLVFRLQVA